MMLLNIVGVTWRYARWCNTQRTLLSDISAVAVWIVYDVVAVYGVHTNGFSPVCDGVNLNDRDMAAMRMCV